MFRLLLAVSALLVFGSVVRIDQVAAQEAAASSGITVTGYGLASAPAETATLNLVFASGDEFGSPPSVPEVEATPGATARSTMEPIVAAIEAHDFVESVEVIIPAPLSDRGYPSTTARLDIEIAAPEQEGIIALINDAARAAGEERLVITYVGAWFGITDCQPLEQQARQAALDDAQRQAVVQAEIAGIELGVITATLDRQASVSQTPNYYGFVIAPGSSCDPPVPATTQISQGLGVISPLYDPVTQPPVVEVYRVVEVTYATGDAATPAA